MRADKKELKKNYSKQLDRNKLVLTQNVLKLDETESKGAKPVYHWERLLKAYLIFLDTIIFSRDRLVSGSAFLHFNAGNGAMPLNPRPKRPPYVVFFVLYEFCVVYVLYKRVVCMLYFFYFTKLSFFKFSFLFKKQNESKMGFVWCEHLKY